MTRFPQCCVHHNRLLSHPEQAVATETEVVLRDEAERLHASGDAGASARRECAARVRGELRLSRRENAPEHVLPAAVAVTGQGEYVRVEPGFLHQRDPRGDREEAAHVDILLHPLHAVLHDGIDEERFDGRVRRVRVAEMLLEVYLRNAGVVRWLAGPAENLPLLKRCLAPDPEPPAADRPPGDAPWQLRTWPADRPRSACRRRRHGSARRRTYGPNALSACRPDDAPRPG